MLQQRLLAVSLCFLCTLAVLQSGCGPKEKIARYRIRKDKSDFLEKMSKLEPKESESRMVVGLLQEPQDCWFFKIHGPKSEVSATEEQWRKFLASVTIENGIPKWETPEGWKMKAVSRMAASVGGYANYQINDSSPPLLMKISRLGGKQNLYENATRWRGQLGLPPIAEQDAESQYEKTEYVKGRMILFDHSGAAGAGGGMGGPFSGGAGKMSGPGKMPPGHGKSKETNKKQQPDTQNPEFTFDVPKGWTEQKDAPVVIAKLLKNDAVGDIAISVTRMSMKFNDWKGNVEQWASDLGIEVAEKEIAEKTEKIQVDDVAGKKILLEAKSTENPDSIVGIMFVKQDFTWFVKMKGDASTVKLSMDDLGAFLKSIRVK